MTIENNDSPLSTGNAPSTGLGEINPPPEPALADLISEIETLNRPVADFWIQRDLGGPRIRLSPEEEMELNRVIQPRNQRIIDLLIARNANDWPTVLVVLNKGIRGVNGLKEKTHPFSDYGVTIHAPSGRSSDSDFKIRVRLSGLRRKGLADDSIGAETLLGEKTEVPDTPENFMLRTQRELAYISRLRHYASQQTSNQQTIAVIDYLDQLTTDIIIGGLMELKRRGKIPPGFGVSFHLLRSKKTHEPKFETTKIRLPGGDARTFMIPGQRIGTALASFGFDYDNEREELR